MTELEIKCDIIEEFMRDHAYQNVEILDIVEKFIDFNDLGVPLAQAVSYKLAELTEEGITVVEETWIYFCEMMMIDPYGEYSNLDDCLTFGIKDDEY